MKRKLIVKREALSELQAADLLDVAAGAPSDFSCRSCLTYVSCYMTDCIGPKLTLNGCLAYDPPPTTTS